MLLTGVFVNTLIQVLFALIVEKTVQTENILHLPSHPHGCGYSAVTLWQDYN
jgi:hypothetical protein